ncbi:gluconokinase [Nocardioides sp.]|uniref:gluconokinase n=1 Tax=Nocardioides sp. TaxID=35761 RepID=UPI002719DD7C|nr:gluconokinase [Nocardioides sp.]MDO9456579.1 gluconokinase [Nocardioides sp.]
MSAVRVVVAGVSGSGKSTVGEALAARLGVAFCDGDDLHPPANVAKMRAGTPLTDADRWPWLDDIGAWLARDAGGVVACSALRRAYRDRLRSAVPGLDVLLLDGDPGLIRARQAARGQHFMPTSLLDSQLATFEPLAPDEAGLTVDVADPVEEIVARYAGGPPPVVGGDG